MTNQQPTNLPQYYQGTPGEVKLAAFLKNHDHLTKTHYDQIISFFRATEYFTANVVEHYITDIHPHPPEGGFHLTRHKRGNEVVLSIQSVPDSAKELVKAPYVDIPALNISTETIKRICSENGLAYTGKREFNNVIVYDFYCTGLHKHKTTLNISVEKDYNGYVSHAKNKAGTVGDAITPRNSGYIESPEEHYGGLRL